jgi:hypothetical protein
LLHAAGPTDEGFRIVEVWASEAHWRRFALERSLPGASIDPFVGARPVIRDLHATHVVLGDALETPGRTPELDDPITGQEDEG